MGKSVILLGKIMNRAGFSISAGAFLVIASAFFIGKGNLIIELLIAVMIHELGHYTAIRICGGKVRFVRVSLTGVEMGETGVSSYSSDIMIAAAGPIASIILAGLCAWLARLCNIDSIYRIAGMSLVFCVFNLLPVTPLDGGKILYNAVARCGSLLLTEKITCLTNCSVIFLVLCAGAYVLVESKTNPSLLLCGIWIAVSCCKKGNNSVESI